VSPRCGKPSIQRNEAASNREYKGRYGKEAAWGRQVGLYATEERAVAAAQARGGVRAVCVWHGNSGLEGW